MPHVVAGVLLDHDGKVLLAQRPAHKHLAGGWELPGGKLEHGESRLAALGRELREELGIAVLAAHPLIRLLYAYPDMRVDLDVWTVTRYAGCVAGVEGQVLRWCPREQLSQAGLLPADQPVITALLLPERILAPVGPGYEVVDPSMLPAGRDVVLDARRLLGIRGPWTPAAAARADFLLAPAGLDAAAIAHLCCTVNVPLYVAGGALVDAWECGACGVHELAG